MTLRDRNVAASKKAAATASNIALWPLAILITKIKMANRIMIRWAMRHRSRSVYLFALFWAPATMLGLLVWAIIVIPNKADADTAWPVLAVAAVLAKKIGAALLYAVEQAEGTLRSIDHYRRQFPRKQQT